MKWWALHPSWSSRQDSLSLLGHIWAKFSMCPFYMTCFLRNTCALRGVLEHILGQLSIHALGLKYALNFSCGCVLHWEIRDSLQRMLQGHCSFITISSLKELWWTSKKVQLSYEPGLILCHLFLCPISSEITASQCSTFPPPVLYFVDYCLHQRGESKCTRFTALHKAEGEEEKERQSCCILR